MVIVDSAIKTEFDRLPSQGIFEFKNDSAILLAFERFVEGGDDCFRIGCPVADGIAALADRTAAIDPEFIAILNTIETGRASVAIRSAAIDIDFASILDAVGATGIEPAAGSFADDSLDDDVRSALNAEIEVLTGLEIDGHHIEIAIEREAGDASVESGTGAHVADLAQGDM